MLLPLPLNANPAALMIGPLGGREHIVQDFYRGCPVEPAVAAWATIEAQSTYTTLEGLFDLLIRQERQQVIIVNHGSVAPVPQVSALQGLIVPFAQGATANATGAMISSLARLSASAGTLTENDPAVDDAAQRMTVSRATALRLIQKLAQVRQKQRVIHLRGCHVGENQDLCRTYKSAFNAILFTAPRCRMLYGGVNPFRQTQAQLQRLSTQRPPQANIRRRSFAWPGNPTRLLVLDVEDQDGHTHFTSTAHIENRNEATLMASLLIRQWNGPDPTRFMYAALWANNEPSYIVPQDPEYTTHLTVV